jgi:resuscitation-promoting factor RpfB
MADGRTALSQHRRRAHAKRQGRRGGSFLLVTTIAVVLAVGAGVLVELHLNDKGSDPAAMALAQIPGSRSAALLEEARQTMILEDSASKTLSLVGTPERATSPAISLPSASAGSAGTDVLVNTPPPDPGTAQSIGFNMLASFGFATSQWGCLDDLWNRESGWVYNAENASGAYGIPQALPGSKMASAGADWLTNPTTQIKWGLGYIKSIYATPCGAWDHEEADGWY